eukprot:TRINITY_DN56542_c0_g1_i1.p1 TRINITY_DN56542_c0_g1~~TRINITY_DN56542_c0_g1_i1.p1  ORF type:complete len:497 (+),score=94.77 TRINITY_DN56542_c0_g1_i1:91-1581(+)
MHDTPPPPPPKAEVIRCSFVVPNKGRRCRFPVLPGTSRCGAHREDADDGPRIPCPLDPNHTVFAKRLKQHLKVCTKVRDESVVEKQPFFRRGVNLAAAGPGDPLLPATPSAPSSAEPVSSAAPEVVEAWMLRIAEAWPRAVREVLGPDVVPEELLELSVVSQGGDVGHAEKHEVQNQALAQLILKDSLLSTSSTQASQAVVVEFGSGKGGLASAVLGLCPGVRCVLVEREPRRHKFENRQDKREETVLRLRLDIADFDLGGFVSQALDPSKLPKARDFVSGALSVSAASATEGRLGPAERLEELWCSAAALQAAGPWPPTKLLACAKHLCGGATDITLRALSAFKVGGTGTQPGSGAAVCVATCCHHRCDAQSYVNRDFLSRIGLCSTPEEFAQFVSTAGWAVGGAGGARDLPKRRVGMMAKRILDLGRVAWLREELGLADATLTDYIGKAVTPENIAIVAGGTPSAATAALSAQPAGPCQSVSRSFRSSCLAWCS